MIIFGLIGTIILTFAGVPQLVKVIRQGHAQGISPSMILMWVLGLGGMFIYVAAEGQFLLSLNYGLNFVISAVILYYCLFRKHRASNSDI